jgi:myo-inositol-1(or 4)-monophosphatase
MHSADLISIRQATIDVVNKAVFFIREETGKIQDAHIEIKSLNSLVTYVDKIAEKILVDGLHQILPEAVFLTEEDTVEQKSGDWQWIIDPLDGTTNFIHAVPVFGVSVGLQYKGEVILGVVTEVNRNECFYAARGQGAYCNGQKIQVSQTKLLKEALVATGFPYYDYSLMENYIELFRHLMTNTRGIRRLGAASIDLCYTACGRFDTFFEYSLSPWDVAAGALILQEAGGEVYDFTGGGNWLYGRQIVGTNALLTNEILQVIRSHF